MKWPPRNQFKHPPLPKNYKTYADLDSTTWKNSSKKYAAEEMGFIKSFRVL